MKFFHPYMDKHLTNGQYEISLEVLPSSYAVNQKKYLKIKSQTIYCVDLIDIFNDKYLYEKNFIKYRHAKKAYKKLKLGFLNEKI